LFRRLAIPGIVGGILGAYVLSSIDATIIKPVVLAYLAGIGLLLTYRGIKYPPYNRAPRHVAPLGLAGGFLDAAGGGGWGPIVTGNLLAQGGEPRRVIGTVNTTEFLLTLTISVTFIATLGWKAFTLATLGLLIGGMIAAPVGARIAARVNPKSLLVAVGILLILTSLFGVYKSLA
jgi:uncharacterized membrane protein YfcA